MGSMVQLMGKLRQGAALCFIKGVVAVAQNHICRFGSQVSAAAGTSAWDGDEELRGAILAFTGYREFKFDSVLGTEEKGSTANVH